MQSSHSHHNGHRPESSGNGAKHPIGPTTKPDGERRPEETPRSVRSPSNAAFPDHWNQGAGEQPLRTSHSHSGLQRWLGVKSAEIAEVLKLTVDHTPLPEVVSQHNKEFPFNPRKDFASKQVWLEGSNNPPTEVHMARALELFGLGFERIVVGVLPHNPRKPRHEYEALAHRIAMWKLLAKYYDVPVASNPSEKGLWFCESGPRCHFERYRSWFDPNRFILMGPDNFTHFRTSNMTWTLLAHKVPIWLHLQQYNVLYEQVFKDRILVPTTQYVLHSTGIRRGKLEPHPAIADYVRQNGLYGRNANR